MRINPILAPIAAIIVMLSAVFGANQLGFWSTSGRSSINLENFVALDIKGWMSIQQVSEGLNLPIDQVRIALNVPASVPNSTAMKDLEKLVPGFETSTARDTLGKPITTGLPTVAATIAAPSVQTMGQVTGTHINEEGIRLTPTALPVGQLLSADQIKGSLSLRQVAEQTNVPLDKLLVKLNLPKDTNIDLALKDLIAQGQITEVTQVREAVISLQTK